MAASPRTFSRARLAIAIGLAVVVNGIVFWIAVAAGAAGAVTQPAYQELTVLVVILATVLPLALAGVVVWFIARRRPAFRRWAAWLGLVVAVVSAVSPLFVSADVATGVALGVMHIVAGVAWFVGIGGASARKVAQ